MSDVIELIVGLGNPDPEHQQTLHNAGFWLVDLIARECGVSFKRDKRLQSELADVRIGEHRVRLLKPHELPGSWDPATDPRLTAWETVHHLIRVLAGGGEGAASELVAKLGSKAETARELAYRLYTLCERKKRAQEALAYNGLVQSWPEISRLANQDHAPTFEQAELCA